MVGGRRRTGELGGGELGREGMGCGYGICIESCIKRGKQKGRRGANVFAWVGCFLVRMVNIYDERHLWYLAVHCQGHSSKHWRIRSSQKEPATFA